MKASRFAFVAIALTSGQLPARAAILYSVPGSVYAQSFDTLPNNPEDVSLGTTANGIGWTDDNATPPIGQFSIPGWYLYHPIAQAEGGANGHQRMRIGAGTANVGAFMSFGASDSPDRALGSISSDALAVEGANDNGESHFGVRITNNTGTTLRHFTLSYTGEQWRDGGAASPAPQSLLFSFKIGASSILEAGFSRGFGDLYDVTSQVTLNTADGAAVDGNSSAARARRGPYTAVGVNWPPGTDLWLRWTDLNDAGNDHGLAIDELTFSAEVIPEPHSLGLLATGVLGGSACRQRRSRMSQR
jgi:hypothetical protein